MTATPTGPADLQGLVRQYVTGRWRRREVTSAHRTNMTWALAGLVRAHGNRTVGQFGPRTVDRWVESVAHMAPSTRRTMLNTVRQFCRWLLAEGHVRRDASAHVPPIPQPRRVPVTFTDEQVVTLRSNLPDLRARVIVALMYDVGARCIEVSRLQVGDYDPASRTLVLTGKGGHERHVPVSATTHELIGDYLVETGVVGGPMVRQYADPTRGLSAQTISRYVSDWAGGAKVKARAWDGRSAHGLRRTCGSDVMDACGDVRIVQAVLGHSNIETTARYYLRPVTVEQMRSAMGARQADE